SQTNLTFAGAGSAPSTLTLKRSSLLSSMSRSIVSSNGSITSNYSSADALDEDLEVLEGLADPRRHVLGHHCSKATIAVDADDDVTLDLLGRHPPVDLQEFGPDDDRVQFTQAALGARLPDDDAPLERGDHERGRSTVALGHQTVDVRSHAPGDDPVGDPAVRVCTATACRSTSYEVRHITPWSARTPRPSTGCPSRRTG